MEFDLQGADKSRAYQLLASVVVPRPIALVTTLGPQGLVNAAPFSYFNLVGSAPPAVAVSIALREAGVQKDSLGNIEASGEFVINLVSEALAPAMTICAIDFPPGVSEPTEAGLSLVPSVKVSPPRLAASPVQLECRLYQVVEMGENRIVLGEVVFLHVQDEFVAPDTKRIHAEALGLIGRMHGGGWYARTTDLFEMPRISYSDWQAKTKP